MLAVKVLGELELELDGQSLGPPSRQSGRLLLGYLALNPGLHARGDLAALLWPEILESSGRVSLRSAIAALRRSLGTAASRYLVASSDALGLAEEPAGVLVDARQFDALVAEGKLQMALELSRGPLLQGLDAEWVRQARTDHLERVSELLGRLAAQEETAGRLEEAVHYTRRQVALSPLAEPPNRDLMRRLVAVGDRASALAVYGELAERLRRELRTVPSAPTRRLVEEARRGDVTEQPVAVPLPAQITSLLDEPFVDRELELASLMQSLDRAKLGAREVVLLSGEPGIGKSSLLVRLAQQAHPGATVLFGRCRRPSSESLEPFAEALRHYVAHVPHEALHRLGPVSELAALVPGISEYLGGPPPPVELLQDGGRMARAVVEAFVSLARERPVLLLLEDLHLADRPTAEVVARLLATAETTRLMIVLSLRDTELERSPVLKRLSSQVRGASGSGEIRLGGLDGDAVAELAPLLGTAQPEALTIRQLQARTDGNPFFVTHLLRSGELAADGPLPPRVEDLIWQEIEQLSQQAQACLSVASLTGEEFDLTTVAQVVGYDENATLDALDEAVLAKMVTELTSGVGRYQFRHSLLREGIQARLTATRQAHLHRRLGDARMRRREEGGPQRLGPVVEHLRAARDLVPVAELAERVLEAANEADAEQGFARAADLYEEAAELVDRDRGHSGERARILVSLGSSARRSGEHDRARSALLAAHRLAVELADERVQIEAALVLGLLPVAPGDRPVDPEVISVLETTLELPGARDDAVRAQLLARLAVESFYDPAQTRPDPLAEDAVGAARRSAEPAALAAALAVGHLAFRGADGPANRLQLARELRARVPEPPDGELLMSALIHQTVDEVELGDLMALEKNASAVSGLAAELKQPALDWWAELWRATRAIATGELEEGAAVAQHAHEVGRITFGPAAELELRAQLAWIALEQERFEQLAAALPNLEGSFSLLPVWQALKARILVETGSEKRARQSLETLIAAGLAALERDTNWLISAALLAETVSRLGDVSLAADLAEVLAPRAEHWAVSARGTVCFGPVSGSLSLLNAVCGDHETAERHYAAAQEQCRTAGAAPAAERLRRLYEPRQTPRNLPQGRTGEAPAA